MTASCGGSPTKRTTAWRVGYRLAVWVLLCMLTPVQAEPILLRFSHVVGTNTPKGLGAAMFKERVQQRLGNKVEVQVYSDSQRFTDDQVLTALLFGDVELAAPSLSKFRSFSERLQVFDLPFLFDDIDAVHRFQGSPTGQALLESMSARGLKGLAYWDNGMRVMSANRPLRSPDDLRGLIFRIEPSRVIEAQYQQLGAVTLRLPFRRVYDALSMGLADGQENSWSNIRSKQFHRVQKHFTETNHSFQGYLVVTSVRFWDSLPPDIRTTLEEVLRQVSQEVRRIARKKAESGRAAVQESAAVLTPNEGERRLWQQALEPVRERFATEIGEQVIAAARVANLQ